MGDSGSRPKSRRCAAGYRPSSCGVLQDGPFQRLWEHRTIFRSDVASSAHALDIQKAINRKQVSGEGILLIYRLNVVHSPWPATAWSCRGHCLLADHFLKSILWKWQEERRAIALSARSLFGGTPQWPGNVRRVGETPFNGFGKWRQYVIQSFHLTPPPRSGSPSASFARRHHSSRDYAAGSRQPFDFWTLNSVWCDKEKAAKIGRLIQALYRHFSKDERYRGGLRNVGPDGGIEHRQDGPMLRLHVTADISEGHRDYRSSLRSADKGPG